MRTLFLVAGFLAICISTQAQQAITITHSDMPNVNDTFRYSVTDDLLGIIDLNDTGPDKVWHFETLGSLNQRVDEFVDPILGTPLIYNVTFSNFFDMNHFATLAAENMLGQFPQNFVSIDEVYDFYRETNGIFANVGLGLTINGFPLTSVMEPRDIIYEFPLEYGDEDDSYGRFGVEVPQFGYYGQKIWRTNTVDAWGELTTRYGTFNTLRVTTILDITDTLSIQGFGFEQPQLTSFEIKWLAKNIGAPLVVVKGQIVFGAKVVNSVEYLDSIRGFTIGTPYVEPEDTTGNPVDTTGTSGILDVLQKADVSVHPNPFNEFLSIKMNLLQGTRLNAAVFDITGKQVAILGTTSLPAGYQVWQLNIGQLGLKPGMYHLVITDAYGGRLVKKVVFRE